MRQPTFPHVPRMPTSTEPVETTRPTADGGDRSALAAPTHGAPLVPDAR